MDFVRVSVLPAKRFHCHDQGNWNIGVHVERRRWKEARRTNGAMRQNAANPNRAQRCKSVLRLRTFPLVEGRSACLLRLILNEQVHCQPTFSYLVINIRPVVEELVRNRRAQEYEQDSHMGKAKPRVRFSNCITTGKYKREMKN